MVFIYYFSIATFLFLCFILCAVILMQESKTTGLGASFGGEQADSVFGTSTADVLKTFTAYLAAIFLVSCVLLNLWTESMARKAEVAQFNAPSTFLETE
jgi:preprotein translocase subunit SecG